jgi:hypothetical protein
MSRRQHRRRKNGELLIPRIVRVAVGDEFMEPKLKQEGSSLQKVVHTDLEVSL